MFTQGARPPQGPNGKITLMCARRVPLSFRKAPRLPQILSMSRQETGVSAYNPCQTWDICERLISSGGKMQREHAGSRLSSGPL